MEESIEQRNIQLGCAAGTWEDAIRVAAAPLVEHGQITPGYVDKMIASVSELGPYIVIMPKLALAHAAPCEDVLESCMALATFEGSVRFGSPNDPVRIVMVLACTDRETHIARLQRVAEKLLDETFVDRMLACGTAAELHGLING